MYKTYQHNGLQISIYEGYWSVQDVEDNPDKLFVFGDNTKRVGSGGQAIIRHLENTQGICTKGAPTNAPTAYWRDDTFEDNKRFIDGDIQTVLTRAKESKQTIVLPGGGFGTGLAYLDKTAPKTFKYVSKRLKEEFGFDNFAALELYK